MTRLRVAVAVLCGLFAIGGRVEAQWGSIVRLTNTDAESYPEGIAAYGNSVHVIFEDEYSPGQRGTMYTRSTDCGDTWSVVTLLDSSTEASCILATDAENVHHFLGTVASDLRYRRSADGGATWSSDQTLCRTGWKTGISVNARANLFVLYIHDDSLWVRTSHDTGFTWEPSRFLVHRNSLGECDIAADESLRLHAVWSDEMAGVRQVYYMRSTDNGTSWEPYRCFGRDDGYPNVLADSQNRVYVLWSESYSPRVGRSTDGGETWAVDSGCQSPGWATAGQNGWLHGTNAWTSGQDDWIVYSRSRDYAATWDTFWVRPPDGTAADRPILAVSDTVVHFIWRDYAPGNAEVFYRHTSIFVAGISDQSGQPRLALRRLSIYPCPAKHRVTLDARGVTGQTVVQVYDAAGRLRFVSSCMAGGGRPHLDVSRLGEGVYQVILRSDSGYEARCGMVVCR